MLNKIENTLYKKKTNNYLQIAINTPETKTQTAITKSPRITRKLRKTWIYLVDTQTHHITQIHKLAHSTTSDKRTKQYTSER